jgi:hypothetical protein
MSAEIKCCIDQNRGLERRADALRLQNQECGARVAKAEYGSGPQIGPVLARKEADAHVKLGFGQGWLRPFLDEQHHKEGKQARDNREIENRADVDVNQIEKEECQNRAQKCPRIVANTFEPECPASVLIVHRGRHERVARRRPATGANAVEQSRAEYALPSRRKPDERLGDGCEKIARERYGLSFLELV